MAEGTRAASVYSLLPSSPLLFENMSPTNFMVDQSPVGLEAGYTWASDRYRNVFAATAQVTNGDNDDGSEAIALTNRGGKDVSLNLDWWYAPESGITFLEYYGSKDLTQNAGLANQFTYHPTIRRQGLFGNYMFFNKVDALGGYLHSRDAWQSMAGVSGGYFTGNDFFGELNYYIVPGLALSGRYDILHQHIDGIGATGIHDWTAAVNKNLTRSGNIVTGLGYSYLTGRDPLAGAKSSTWRVQADIMFNF